MSVTDAGEKNDDGFRMLVTNLTLHIMTLSPTSLLPLSTANKIRTIRVGGRLFAYKVAVWVRMLSDMCSELFR